MEKKRGDLITRGATLARFFKRDVMHRELLGTQGPSSHASEYRLTHQSAVRSVGALWSCSTPPGIILEFHPQFGFPVGGVPSPRDVGIVDTVSRAVRAPRPHNLSWRRQV